MSMPMPMGQQFGQQPQMPQAQGPQVMAQMGQPMEKSTVGCLRILLAATAAFTFKARGFHWNVEGPSFAQFHDFFGDLYEDLDGMVDDVAENIRKCGDYAPYQLSELAMISPVQDAAPGADPIAMCTDALAANDAVLQALHETFECAEAEGDQGLMDYLAGRMDTHRKHAWMLRAFTGKGKAQQVGKSARRALGLS